ADGTAVVLLAVDGRVAAAAGAGDTLAPVADMPPVVRIDDLRRAGDGLQVLFAGEGNVESLAVLVREGKGWRAASTTESGTADATASRIAGEAGDRIYAVIAG